MCCVFSLGVVRSVFYVVVVVFCLLVCLVFFFVCGVFSSFCFFCICAFYVSFLFVVVCWLFVCVLVYCFCFLFVLLWFVIFVFRFWVVIFVVFCCFLFFCVVFSFVFFVFVLFLLVLFCFVLCVCALCWFFLAALWAAGSHQGWLQDAQGRWGGPVVVCVYDLFVTCGLDVPQQTYGQRVLAHLEASLVGSQDALQVLFRGTVCVFLLQKCTYSRRAYFGNLMVLVVTRLLADRYGLNAGRQQVHADLRGGCVANAAEWARGHWWFSV